MADVLIRVDARAALADLERLRKNDLRAALSRAMRIARRAVATEANREIRETLNLKMRELSRAIVQKRISRDPAIESVEVLGQAEPLTAFRGTRETAAGLRIQVERRPARLAHAFLIDWRGRQVAVQRAELGGRRVERLPLVRLFGPAPPQAIQDATHLDRIEGVGRRAFEKAFAHEIEFREAQR